MGNIKQQTLVYPIPDACVSCKYYSRSHRCCDYIEIEHHSRTFDNKGRQKRYILDGIHYCDKYCKGQYAKRSEFNI